MVGTRSSAPREDAAALPESERGMKHFRLIWPEFKKRGWTSKPPPSRGIETRWKYILRDGNANGTIGIDYVLGEQAVVDHATNSKWFGSKLLIGSAQLMPPKRHQKNVHRVPSVIFQVSSKKVQVSCTKVQVRCELDHKCVSGKRIPGSTTTNIFVTKSGVTNRILVRRPTEPGKFDP
ncbi:hypothetical protein PPTG_04466 [Phytophthora nicotianae INRA-310]|uniref:Uncharacterized protein n=1 Tax=Phytophthora nicotianae (strain INRA-310) TaxID=761204 RepID=W2R2V9_PHYN3|nr:hypothetical protein PPTG_04466 [Phytophthora nicotianae INRA-310]ETN19049.1 hypothetical protein PPTG_04466 [Phytophthora nicotianae INRA-310]